MGIVTLRGVLPGSVNENAAPGDWVGTLALAGDLGLLVGIETLGPQAQNFTARFDAANGLARIGLAAPLDYERFATAGLPAEADFSLRFLFSDGSFQDDTTIWRVAVNDLHDSPPTALAFATSGQVLAGAIGAVIGPLIVTDPDWSGPFSFDFGEDNNWRFEVTGGFLKLRAGISLGLDDVGDLALPIEVSDGQFSAGFTLHVAVLQPDAHLDYLPLLAAGQDQSGFSFTGTSAVSTFHAFAEVGTVNTYGGDIRQLLLRDTSQVWLPPVQEMRFADGSIDFDGTGFTAQTIALYHAVLSRDPDPGGLYTWATALRGGMATTALTTAMLECPEYFARIGHPDDATFVTALYRDALGREPDAAGLATWTQQLASHALTRTQVAADFALSAESFARLDAAHPDGFWMQVPFGREVAMIYHAGFNRLVDPTGYAGWTNALQAGTLTLQGLADQFGISQEFLNRYGPVDDTGFVTGMYRDALGRAPDPGGLAHWVGLLGDHSFTRADMLGLFAFCQEQVLRYTDFPAGLDVFAF